MSFKDAAYFLTTEYSLPDSRDCTIQGLDLMESYRVLLRLRSTEVALGNPRTLLNFQDSKDRKRLHLLNKLATSKGVCWQLTTTNHRLNKRRGK